MSTIPPNVDPSWQNSGLSMSELDQVAQALGYQSISDPGMPPANKLSDQQIVLIGMHTDPEVVAKLATYMNDVIEPQLDPADHAFDTSEMMMALSELNKELGEMGIDFAKEGVKIDKDALKSASQERITKLKESIEKMEKASKSGLAAKIFGWIGVGLAVIAAAATLALTIASGGAAAPLMALAIAGLVIACGSAVMMGLEEAGVMEKAYEGLGKMFGLEGKALEDFKMGMQIAVTVVLLVASVATGFGIGAAMKGLEVTAKAAIIASQIARAAAVAGAVASIGGGAAGIATSVQGYEATQSLAESKEFLAWMAQLQASIDQQTEELQELMEKLQNMAFVSPKEILDSIRESFNAIVSESAQTDFA